MEATKSKGKRPLRVAENAEQKEKARPRQSIIKEDEVFMTAPHQAPQPDLDEPTGCGRFMSFNNLGSLLPLPSFANPWWSAVVGAPNLPPAVPPQRQLPGVPQSHIIGPTSVSRQPPAKFCEPSAKPHVICDPLPNDILLGRGKPVQNRPGNVRFREMIDKHVDKYDEGETGNKIIVSANVVRILKEKGGRFLKELKDGGWFEVDEATARGKVSHAFRTRRRAVQATFKKDKRTA